MPIIYPTEQWVQLNLVVPDVGLIRRVGDEILVDDLAANWLVGQGYAVLAKDVREIISRTSKAGMSESTLPNQGDSDDLASLIEFCKTTTLDDLVAIKGISQQAAKAIIDARAQSELSSTQLRSLLNDRQIAILQKHLSP